jgi:hypothetical protein
VRARAWLVLAGSLASAAHAAHPMLTEDPGTQGQGGFELEVGYSSARGLPSGGRAAVLAPQLSWGVLPDVDLIVNPIWLEERPPEGGRNRSLGNLPLDAKWRFVDAGPLQVAVRAGVDLPTGDESRTLSGPYAGLHAVLASSYAWESSSLLANLGYVYSRNPGSRRNLPYATVAFLHPSEGVVRAFAEVAAAANPDPSRSTWPAVARTGVMWKATDWLDLDAGIEGRLNRAAPSFAALVGVTVHW